MMLMMMMQRLNARNVHCMHQIAMLNSANYNDRTWLTTFCNDYVTDVSDKQHWFMVVLLVDS